MVSVQGIKIAEVFLILFLACKAMKRVQHCWNWDIMAFTYWDYRARVSWLKLIFLIFWNGWINCRDAFMLFFCLHCCADWVWSIMVFWCLNNYSIRWVSYSFFGLFYRTYFQKRKQRSIRKNVILRSTGIVVQYSSTIIEIRRLGIFCPKLSPHKPA